MKGLLAPFTVLALAIPSAAQEAAPAAKRVARALLVGCTEYPHLEEAGRVPGSNTIELRGPVHDVELFARALRETYGVGEAAMQRLVGWPDDEAARPTKANVVRGFQKLAADSKSGDWAVVYLAGHGSQQPSSAASLDDEPDGLDEIFLPADARPAPDGAKVPNALSDDEIRELVAAIRAKGAEVWLVVDACHSGTLLRGGSDVVLRRLPPSVLGVRGPVRGVGSEASTSPAATPRARADFELEQGVAAFYGAQSFGSAPEMELPVGASDARPHGLFTYLLVREMRRAGGAATYGELLRRVVAAYQAFPCHLTVPMGQGDLERPIGGGARLAERAILAEFGSGAPRVDQGLVSGLEPGARIHVVADGAPLDGEPLVELEVTEAGTHDARCAVVSGKAPEGHAVLRARVASRPIGGFTIQLALVAPDERALDADKLPEPIARLVADAAGKFRLTDPARADWRVVLDGDRIHLRAAEHSGSPDRLDLSPARAVLELGRIRRVHGMRRVCALFGAPDPSLDVWIEHRARGSGIARRLRAGERIAPGDEVRVLLQKSGEGVVDAHVYFLDANHAPTRLFPRTGHAPRLEPKAGAPLELVPWTPVIDDALGFESVWVLAVPRQASDPVVELENLEDDPTTTRGFAQEESARGLLTSLFEGPRTRGLAAGSSEPAAAGSVFQVPVTTAWPAVTPPVWGARDPETAESTPPSLAGLPIAFDPGPCFELRSSPAAAGARDVLVLGTAEAPRAILIDFDPPAGPPARPRDFDAEAAFLFLDGGARLALYDPRDQGVFERALLDADGDGLAERRWTRDGAGWNVLDGVRSPWLSQVHLSPAVVGRDAKRATARLSAVTAGSRP